MRSWPATASAASSINDNPTKWFVKSHPIRVADRVLNKHFAGTYQAYLALTPGQQELSVKDAAAGHGGAPRAPWARTTR